ncbi:Tol-Pal system beta propeller repeat protein TolB [Rickettsiella endosymbiont of Dermanyssus gallinae]|uniref:Tol-Pal system beta propeller repeat protein TolB n=1 Tax=Rickettsiella endosymbiont of Dermanyssus gallinae TaxID=2856608 RepID=UPI001FE6ED43|nr:Tol-Pal system beta propeller repeat protein TolB [Rickettsiella endosymbiont of Dermanyssus gallinae]
MRTIIILLLIDLWVLPARAALNLELTQGISNQLPIAIVPFSGSANLAETSDVSAIIKNDLNNSGQFKVTTPQNGILPYTLSQVSASYWRNKKFDDVVVGQIQTISQGQYRVRFSLVNVAQGQSQALIQQEFTANEAQLRRLSHHISDLIYEKLIGLKGVFSTRIAYILVTDKNSRNRRYSLQVADMDGYNAKSLLISTQPIMSPAWSRDGKRLAYVSFEKVLPRIYIQQVNTGARELVSSYSGINGAPAWSPDDKTLALALSKDSAAPKIYLMDLANKKLRQITFGPSIDTEPSFSKDGRSLLFTSDRGGAAQIYQLALRSGVVRRVTFDGNYNARASFANDGKTIVVLNQEQGSYNIAVQDLDDDNTLQILTHSGYDASPSFAPNGQMLLYESKPGNRSMLGMVSVDGRINLRLPTPQGDVQDPTWSPFMS